ncbi:DNA/RNA-binding domain of Phe-tRNA-synthetase-like protein [Aurantimicrobium minutum]|jgi:DNA/RNA-binding domain of Phe-tRNA-synthetase-like protein|uniref:B3/B4 domain-containing protein n=1 Tax=Aurantimicrobium minutum TaxID=708131 RepID=UPI002475A542|nr:phenylalanine--tRNA ligase beta subunit-related protein [Aurantimicrobium minutum]MDH6207336.1 DNA/RNA-binding domain of Phe-tRNA-synthetase-like protein [Aurantimicrobium minutum]MDH6255009.1 DNA/RNA-binding domain of Phe-tRNA-synthetase-like protein [Aurantimicrobium minutum]MDH6409832.1 DNA/RNA-binding domain of Phe-tRNA-synthetase-like protein [Aurantimicrobium minutum]MDH6424040.1 DNA/RNA-binding domain of Phe-tRNA-synthetase-like protein [Aurantimicrobium minutum]
MSAAQFLEHSFVSDEVWDLHPDYVVVLLVVEGLQGGESDQRSEALLVKAEASAAELLAAMPIEEVPEVQIWREKFLSFGVKPRVAKSSSEALLKRCAAGMPRVNMLTDLYNAVSVINMVPIGGEDFDSYVGSARLVVADGSELFDTRDNGETVNESPEPGEIVWRDDDGITCRRWNWRQCVRTRLTEETTNAVFIFDGVGECARERVESAAAQLSEKLREWWPDVVISSKELSRS